MVIIFHKEVEEMNQFNVLVVDDDKDIRDGIEK